MPRHAIAVGESVSYRRGGQLLTGIVVSLERARRPGERFGVPVESITWAERYWGCFVLADGTCCAGSELVS